MIPLADVDEEPPAGDVADDSGDSETAGEPDVYTDTAEDRRGARSPCRRRRTSLPSGNGSLGGAEGGAVHPGQAGPSSGCSGPRRTRTSKPSTTLTSSGWPTSFRRWWQGPGLGGRRNPCIRPTTGPLPRPGSGVNASRLRWRPQPPRETGRRDSRSPRCCGCSRGGCSRPAARGIDQTGGRTRCCGHLPSERFLHI